MLTKFSRKFFSTIDKENIEKNFTKLNYYGLLSLKPNDNVIKVRKNYYTLSKHFHPDVYKGSIEIFKKLSEAYTTLRDPNKREEYNKKLRFFHNFRKYDKPFKASTRWKEDSEKKEEEEQQQTTSKFEDDFKKLDIDHMFDRYYTKPIKHKAQNLKVIQTSKLVL